MSDETLLTAARRFVRYFDIDMAKGGLITEETQKARNTLELQIRCEAQREKEKETMCPPRD